jgi:hypothetical protein
MNTGSKRIEDLPVQAEQAAEVKGGVVPDAPELSATYLSAGVVKAFNVKAVVDPNDKSVIDPND